MYLADTLLYGADRERHIGYYRVYQMMRFYVDLSLRLKRITKRKRRVTLTRDKHVGDRTHIIDILADWLALFRFVGC